MLFNSIDFILFFPIVAIIYYLIPNKVRYIWLLVCSYYFYMCWNAKYALLLLFSTAVTYVVSLLLEKIENSDYALEKKIRRKKLTMVFGLAVNLVLLGYFKYFNFFTGTINKVLEKISMEMVIPQYDILLPVGISFFVFQALSYTIDVYRKEIYAEKNFFKYALFVSFFPQLVAGPIERSKNLLKQINEKHRLEYKAVWTGLLLLLWGFFLKLVLADRIAIVVNEIYGSPENYPGVYIVVATVLFAFQIYCDFNGYTMIARGAAGIMGFQLMENFDAPYYAGTVSEFWRRWHISLTSWFRDYLYIPLGGNRKGKIRKYLNILTVFGLSGLWHGASWTYVIWGLLNGFYQVVGDLLKPARDFVVEKCGIKRELFSHKFLKWFTTFVFVDFAWLFFRAEGLGHAKLLIKQLFHFNPWILFDGSLYQFGLAEKNFQFMIGMLLVLFAVDYCKYKKLDIIEKIYKQGVWLQAVVFAILFWVIIIFGIYGVEYEASQFIYFQF